MIRYKKSALSLTVLSIAFILCFVNYSYAADYDYIELNPYTGQYDATRSDSSLEEVISHSDLDDMDATVHDARYLNLDGEDTDVTNGTFDMTTTGKGYFGSTYKASLGGTGFSAGYFEGNNTLAIIGATDEAGYFQNAGASNTVALGNVLYSIEAVGDVSITGDVGIGTTNPSTQLEVAGSATISDIVIPTIFNDMSEPTGFENTTDSALSFVGGATPTFTITGTDFGVYFNGVKVLKDTDSIEISDDTGIHWIYYDKDTQVLSESTTLVPFNHPYIATVYWNATTDAGLLGEERHGFVMDWHTHTLLHLTVGTRYESGLTGTFTNTTLSITSGVIDDEDISHILGDTETTCDVLYKNGDVDFEWDLAQTTYFKEVEGVLQYNNENALANVDNNKYIAMWIFATNDTTTPILALMGQRQDNILAAARENNKFENLILGTLPFQEMKILYRVIIRNQAGTTTWIENQDLRGVSNLPAGTFLATLHSTLTDLGWALSGHNDLNFNVDRNNDDRVGIGTISPATALEVVGTLTGDDVLLSGDIDVNGDNINCDGDLTITPAGGDTNIVGQLGIGVADPVSALQVVGAIDDTPNTVGVHLGTSGDYGSLQFTGAVGGFIDFSGSTGDDYDFRAIYSDTTDDFELRSDGVDNIIVMEADTGEIGIGTATPTVRLQVLATAQAIALFDSNQADYSRIIVDGAANADAQITFQNNANSRWSVGNDAGTDSLIFRTGAGAFGTNDMFAIQSDGDVGIIDITPSGQLHVDQSSTSAAQPVLMLDQADVSEEAIRIVGTSANTVLTQTLVEAADVGTATIAGYFEVYINDVGDQLADQAYYVPFYTLAAPE